MTIAIVAGSTIVGSLTSGYEKKRENPQPPEQAQRSRQYGPIPATSAGYPGFTYGSVPIIRPDPRPFSRWESRYASDDASLAASVAI
jgi:hypothetical protein